MQKNEDKGREERTVVEIREETMKEKKRENDV